MAGRREIDQPSSLAKERRKSVDENKVAEVIGAKLRLKAVRCMTKRCGHHARIGDDHIQRVAFFQQPFGTEAYAYQAGKIKSNQLKAPSANRSVLPYLSRRLLGLSQVPSRTNHRRTMRRQRPCRLDPKPRGDSGHENAFAAQIKPSKTSSVVEVAPNPFAIFFYLRLLLCQSEEESIKLPDQAVAHRGWVKPEKRRAPEMWGFWKLVAGPGSRNPLLR